jgi:hypothetical protein
MDKPIIFACGSQNMNCLFGPILLNLHPLPFFLYKWHILNLMNEEWRKEGKNGKKKKLIKKILIKQ